MVEKRHDFASQTYLSYTMIVARIHSLGSGRGVDCREAIGTPDSLRSRCMEDETLATSALFRDPSHQLLCVIASRVDHDSDAQIAVSVYSASIVEEKPRLVVMLWCGNHTRDLVAVSGVLAISVLSRRNLSVVSSLGLRTASEDGKPLEGLPLGFTDRGLAYVEDSVGYAECRVLTSLELGDATAFVVAPDDERQISNDSPITWAEAAELLGSQFREQYRAKFEADQREASAAMLWL
jgi:flavin reductase (DIM6/NTAB) family NADH-FMN oxidoreductase RutF